MTETDPELHATALRVHASHDQQTETDNPSTHDNTTTGMGGAT